jgi:ABC-2 type transport system permease protein
VRKLLLIARKEVVLRLTDPAVLLLTIVAPLAVTVLIDVAFGDLVLSQGIPNPRIPVGIVNRDQGGEWGNFGEVIMHALNRDSDGSPVRGDARFDLFSVREIGSEARARRMVRQGKLIAALLIPPDFSTAWSAQESAMEVYLNDTYDFRGVAFASLIETLGRRTAAAETTAHTTIEALAQHPRTRAQLRAGTLNEALAELALTAALPESNPIKVERVSVTAPQPQVRLTHYLAAALAISFTGFTALMGSASLLEERSDGTLQRMYITPTRPWIVLGGKTLGTYANGLVQMGAMVGGVSALEGILGRGVDAGAVDLLGLALITLATVAAATGLGVGVAGFARNYEQAATYGRAVVLLMGLVGGIFLPVALLPRPFHLLSRLTFQYWAMGGFLRTAARRSAFSILPHTLVLWVMGASFFAVGSLLLKRRIEFL